MIIDRILKNLKRINNMHYNNAGSHNGIYRGENITELFYDGTLSEEIANETFDDIFIGDYIIGQWTGIKYLVADMNYRLHTGSTECTTPHVLMIPEISMGTVQMNSSNTTSGAYVGSEMYTTNLSDYKTLIQNDFSSEHILTHYNHFQNEVTDGYESNGTWYESDIDLMNEIMVYGTNIFHNVESGTNRPHDYEIDNSQLALFRLNKSKIIAYNASEERESYWLRSVVDSTRFAAVNSNGTSNCLNASTSHGVRPAFLIY